MNIVVVKNRDIFFKTMKKSIIAIALVVSVLFIPISHAQTINSTDIQNQSRQQLIALLQKMIAILTQQLQIALQQAGSATSTTPASTSSVAQQPTPSSCYYYNTLNQLVQNPSCANQTIPPTPIAQPNSSQASNTSTTTSSQSSGGSVSPTSTSTTPVTTPFISQISPSSVPQADVVNPSCGMTCGVITIMGSNFTPLYNNVFFNGYTKVPNIPSSDGKTLTFTIPYTVDNKTGKVIPTIKEGTYALTVSNSNGASNGMNLVVTNRTIAISPPSGPSYRLVTATAHGFNFTPTNNSINFWTANFTTSTANLSSSDGKVITFSIPTCGTVCPYAFLITAFNGDGISTDGTTQFNITN